jgi:hypothetical protein
MSTPAARSRLKWVATIALIPCAVLTACATVNADSGRSATDRFALLDRDAAPTGIPVGRTQPGAFGSFPEDIVGTVTYLGKTTDISGMGTVVVGPGITPAESIVTRFRQPSQFSYEAVTLAATDQGSFLTAIEVTNPLDSRISLQCTITGGMKLDPGVSTHHNRGRCAGGTTLHSTSSVANRREARWNGRDVVLLTTQTNIAFSGAVTGTLSERNDVPTDDQTLAVRTELDVDIMQMGNHFHQQLVRTVIPPVEEK